MKRRVLSFIIALALCLNLFPAGAFAAGAEADDRLCPHHPEHTDECGYALPVLEQKCTHSHNDGCYTEETNCIHEHTAECYPELGDDSGAGEPVLCAHLCTRDSGCVTAVLSCRHAHDDACGYAAGNPGAPCTFACKICPIEDLISKLPRSVSADNAEQVQAQVQEIFALYEELTGDEQQQVDLSACAALLEQIDGMGSAVWSDDPILPDIEHIIEENKERETPYEVKESWIFNTAGHTVTGLKSSTIQVQETGRLYLKGGGQIISNKGAGVEVWSGGFLSITESNVTISGTTYGLDIAEGAEVHLSTGTYIGLVAAIRTADGKYAALLEPGYTYFDAAGNRILPEDMAKAVKVVVDQCKDHSDKEYVHTKGTTEHTWACTVCGIGEPEPCAFEFQQDGTGACVCGNGVKIVVDEQDLKNLVYDGTIKPEQVGITVTLTDGSNKELVKGTDYTVNYQPRTDAGTITVTVTGTFNGTFEKTYSVAQDKPGLTWDTAAKPVPVEVDYDGEVVEAGELPPVKINIQSSIDDLQQFLQYSHKEQGETDYTNGLPANAGTYDVIVSLPEMPNFEAAVSDPIRLTIRPISPIVTAPAAARPVYNGAEQELVTAGTLDPVAVGDGLEIRFAESETGSYSTTIPKGTSAGTNYSVWYKVVGLTGNYIEPDPNPAEVSGVEILRKQITPTVTLSQYSFQYDNEDKQPAVTVKDTGVDPAVVLPDTEYKVSYENNRNVGTAKVIVSDESGGNYHIKQVEVEFEITLRTQEALSITQKPNTVIYGDQFTLGTSGGSGNGLVTWEIIAVDGVTVAKVDQNSGQVTIIGDGSATVKATKSGTDPGTSLVNYEDATAVWTLNAQKKPVTATVTAEDKDYDGDRDATVHAEVEQGVLAEDEITITGLTGTFGDEKAGADKTVTVDTSKAVITGKNSEHYDVSYSSTTVKATIKKAVVKITTPPVFAVLTYDGTAQTLIATGAVVDTAGVPVEYALSEEGPYSTDFPKGINAGDYTVWYRVKETDNYTGLAPASVEVTIAKKPVRAVITLDQNDFVYDGTTKEPVVTLKEADGTLISDTEYTVVYSNNTNVGTATVTVTAKPDGNYSFENAPVTETFEIQKEKAKVTTAPEAAGLPLIFNTFDQRLVTAGVASGGTMVYSVDDENGTYSADIPAKTDAAKYTVYYKVQGDSNHSDSEVGHVEVTIAPKTVKDPTITLFDEDGNLLVSYIYDGSEKKPTPVVVDGSTLIDIGEYEILYENNIDAGNTATVNIIDKPGGNYTVTDSKTFVIVKADIKFDSAPSAAAITYDGKSHELLVPGTTSGGTVQYALGSATSAYSDAIPTGINAGDYTVYYKVVGDKNHNDLNDLANQKVDVTIQQRALTDIIIELTPDSFVYDGTPKMPEVAVKDGKTILPEEEYTWSCSNNSPTDNGTYTITIKDAAGGNYDLTGVTTNTATFSIGQTAQAELVIEGKPASTIYGDTFTLSTSGGSSSSAVVWSVTGPATVDESTGDVKITGAGEVTITATNPGDGNYLPVSDQWTFTAAPKPVMAAVTVANRDYDGTTDATVTAASIPTINGDTVNIDPTSITAAFESAGVGIGKTVTLDVSAVQVTGADVAKYAISYPATVKADITAKSVTVTVTLSGNDLKIDSTKDSYYYEYNGTERTPTVTVTTGDGKVLTAGSDYSVSITDNKNVGDAIVTVTAKPDGNYTFSDELVKFAIRKASAELASTPLAINPTYNGTAQNLVTVGTATGGTVVYALKKGTAEPGDTDYSEDIPQETNAGTYTVYYMVEGDANHTDTAPNYTSATIKPKEITPKITLTPDRAYVYDGNAHKPAVTVMDGTDTIDSSEYNVSYQDNVNAGTARVIVSNANRGNYIVNGTATFEITRKVPTFTLPEAIAGLQYNGGAQELVKAGVCDEGTVVYSVNDGDYYPTIPVGTAVGTYTVKYKVLGDANHSNTDPVTLTVEIAKNTVNTPTISLSSPKFTYNGSPQKPTITVSDDAGRLIPEREYKVEITDSSGHAVDAPENVGVYTVKITTPGASNYVIKDDGTANVRKFEIVAADQESISITGTQAQVYYGDTISLGVTGGTGVGAITWNIKANNGSAITSTIGATGLLTVQDVGGPFTVTVTRSRGGNYTDVSASWEFSAAKKPVTADVTIAPKSFDGNTTIASTDITATVKAGDLVSGDAVNISGLTASYADASVGTGKPVTVNSSNAVVSGKNSEKYDVTYPATVTASILAVAATVDAAPDAVSSLTYDASQSQELVTAGAVTGGVMVYSLNGTDFTPVIPKAKDAGPYKVYYKAQGDSNHTDSEADTVDVTIGKQSVTPQIELTPPSAQYDNSVKRPEVTVRDTANNLIPEGEYTVVYDPTTNWKDVGDHKVTVKNVAGGNYVITETNATFVISITAQNPLEIVNKPGLVYYGDTFTLSAVGGSVSGAVTWSSSDETIAHVDTNGFVTIKGTGSATITATKTGDGNYDTVTANYPLNALKKRVTAIVTVDDKVFDGNTDATLHVTWEKGALVGDDEIKIETLTGAFGTSDAGTNKKVTFTCTFVADATFGKYDITLPDAVTASILKADAAAPALTANNREYDGTTQALVTGGGANTLYSGSRDGVYTAAAPTGTGAGTYTVWYKEKGDGNHNDSESQSIQVTISRKSLTADSTNVTLTGSGLKQEPDGTYYCAYDGTEKKPTVIIKDNSAVIPATEYEVSYSGNQDVGEATVTITSNEGGNYDVSGSVTFKIRKGGAELTRPPEAVRDLTYTGQPLELVTAGAAAGGHIEYALDGGAYGKEIPKADKAGTYTVSYKVVGDENHKDDPTVWSVTVTIKPKEVISPKITVSGAYTYDGNAQVPADGAVEVKDGTTTIPTDEYSLDYEDNVNAGTAKVIVINANGGNYIVNGTGTFTIAKGTASVATAPTGRENLPYNGTAQALAEAGSANGGTMVYALSETGEYSPAIPTQTAVGNYTVWYKVQGDGNHNDSAAASVDASIITNTVTNPTIQVEPPSVTYNGEKQEPAVTVRDDNGLVIDGSEYTVTYADETGNDDLNKVGTYTLTITGKGTNYSFTATATYKITPAGQTPLTITGKRERVYYGDTIQLGTEGGNGTVTWSVSDSTIATITNGLLKITGVGSVTVTATSSKIGYEDQTATWQFYAEKKPVTAVVTAAAKTYDGNTTAEVTAALKTSDLVDSDTVTIKLSGSFEDANAGTDKKVTVDSSSPDFTGSIGHPENYLIDYPATATASILKADVKDVKAPEAVTGLEYTGLAQPLVTAGSSTEGTMEYSLDDGRTYSASLPTGIDAGDYEVWYRVKGDGNHKDTAGTKLGTVTIAPQEVTDPIIELTPDNIEYDGKMHKPAVTVKDNEGRVIPGSEYDFRYSKQTDWIAVGKHTVIITDKEGGNYTFNEITEDFTINPAGQGSLSIVNQPGRVQYGDTFTLAASGGTVTGAVTWTSSNPLIASIDQNGLVTVHQSGGPVTITARREVQGYEAVEATWSFSAEKRAVTPIVTARSKEYDTTDRADLVITWKDGDLLKGDTITLDLTGKFDTADAGTNKTVNITGTAPNDDRYDITLPTSTTASITPKAASVEGTTPDTLTYNGSVQALVSGLTATNGTLAYSRNGSYYTLSVPKETNAGTYTVWYKAQASGNYTDSPAVGVEVTIKPKPVTNLEITLSSDTFDYDGKAKEPGVVVKDGNTVIPDSEYTVRYTNNINVGTATVTISSASGSNYIISGSKTFTIKAGAPALLDAPEAKENLVYTGKAQTLVTRGSAVNGQVVYCVDEEDGEYELSLPKATDAGSYEVWYKVQGENGAAETQPESVVVEIAPKPVTPTVLLNGQYSYSTPYTGSAVTPDVTVKVNGQELNNYNVSYSKNTNVGTAEIIVESTGGNYEFFKVVTFEITKAKATFAVKPMVQTLEYNGEPQKLVTTGVAAQSGLLVVYSTGSSDYLPVVPTETNRGEYLVIAKVQGNEMYEDSELVVLYPEIKRNEVQSATVSLSTNSMNYTGGELKPNVTVIDKGKVIPAGEYTVSYSDNVNVGEATVTVTGNTNNYTYFTAATKFTIVDASQSILAITGKPDHVYYGDTVTTLKTNGGSGSVTWSITSGGSNSTIDQTTGRLVVKDGGTITVKAASGSLSDSWTFTVDPKPATAVITAANRPYNNGTNADLIVTISGLVSGDNVTNVTATGHFFDADAGENKTVFIDNVTIPPEVSAKYDISWPATTTASITPKAAEVKEAPQAVPSLTYTGSPQALLVTPGTAEGGELAYSLDGGSYSFDLPTATDVGNYTVWYKVIAMDENHKDSAPVKMASVTVNANTDTPSVLCTPDTFRYDGTKKTPAVVVRDSKNNIIPESEYTVEFPANPIDKGTYTVKVTDKTGGNYEFTSPVTGTFQIVAASQNPLSIITDKPTDVYYGETFRLSAMGGSGSGAIHWSIKENNGVATIDGNGVVTVKGTGGFTVEAYREAADGYDKSNTASVPFEAKPKPVTPMVTAESKPYDGKTDATLKAAWKSGDLVENDMILLTVEGKFATADVGTGKQVNITSCTVEGDAAAKYTITWPESTTASIYKVDAKLDTAPAASNLTYTGGEQNLVTGGTTENSVGVVVYSTSEKGTYSTTIPVGTNAGKYTVWYKVEDSVNYTGIPAASIEVEIAKADPKINTNPTASGTTDQKLREIKLNGGATDVTGTFAWANLDITAVAGTWYDVIFTPNDKVNYNTVTIQVQAVAPTTSTPGFSSPNSGWADSGASAPGPDGTPTNTTVQNGAASTVVSSTEGDRLVQEAVEKGSETIVIKPEITSDVTKAQVSIPASTVSRIESETDAALTVSSPIADVTIPNAALDTLSRTGGTISVVTEQVEQAVAVTLTADGKTVENVPGGLTVTIPAEDAGPGTVAVLVHPDGTREIIQKSVVEDGRVSVPLSGSATVEIVDNSKSFDDVPPTDWAADAVAFASARQLFSGTSETTFSPDEPMSRGMLATVLYNLEGQPDQTLALQALESGYSDVSSDAWYADGIAWAVRNGIVNGYGDGQFGPNDSVTREQFVVILWRYVGSPEAADHSLAFTDAGEASSYALEALCWAVESGILSGNGSGQLIPGGTATRAEAAQMLKNFMENT